MGGKDLIYEVIWMKIVSYITVTKGEELKKNEKGKESIKIWWGLPFAVFLFCAQFHSF